MVGKTVYIGRHQDKCRSHTKMSILDEAEHEFVSAADSADDELALRNGGGHMADLYYTCNGCVGYIGEPCTSCRGIDIGDGYMFECPYCGAPVSDSHDEYGGSNYMYMYACGTVTNACINEHTRRSVPYRIRTSHHDIKMMNDDNII